MLCIDICSRFFIVLRIILTIFNIYINKPDEISGLYYIIFCAYLAYFENNLSDKTASLSANSSGLR